MLVLDLKHEKGGCKICSRIKQIKNHKNPFYVAELETGYVCIGEFQFFKGYTVFMHKEHVRELHDLKEEFRMKYLKEMTQVAEAVHRAFKPEKLNYELLGNTSPHLNWHIFPRHDDDPEPKAPTWSIDKSVRSTDNVKPTKKEINTLRAKLLAELEKTAKVIDKATDIPLPEIYNI